MTAHPDVVLDYWADRFIAARVGDVMTFETFMSLAEPLRERRIAQMGVVRNVQHRADRDLPDAAMRGDRMIDPMRHGLRPIRNRWFHRPHSHV